MNVNEILVALLWLVVMPIAALLLAALSVWIGRKL